MEALICLSIFTVVSFIAATTGILILIDGVATKSGGT